MPPKKRRRCDVPEEIVEKQQELLAQQLELQRDMMRFMSSMMVVLLTLLAHLKRCQPSVPWDDLIAGLSGGYGGGGGGPPPPAAETDCGPITPI